MDTRMHLKSIIDYQEVYGSNRPLEDAYNLIKGIPSITLISYISGFNIKLYLNDIGEEAHNIQVQLLNNLIVKAGQESIDRFKEIFQSQLDQGHWPIVFWRYSNLVFYDLIFKNYNRKAPRDLTNEEAKNVLDAYLIVNSETSNRFEISKEEIEAAANAEETESIILPNFIYQKDYVSTIDFSNQLTRGVKFFEWLEASDDFSDLVQDYYDHLKVSGSGDVFHNLLTIFTQVGIGEPIEKRKQIIPLWNLIQFLNKKYIDKLCINSDIEEYQPDITFSKLRNRMLFDVGNTNYFLLDINFLIDQLYKAQVFGFKFFIEENGYRGNFLSVKGKDFMEDIYFRLIMEKCFPYLIRFHGDEMVDKEGKELCDYYLRIDSKIILIEFKDILLSATVKDNAEKDSVYGAINTKLVENQKKNPKGVRQLVNAINKLEQEGLSFDDLSKLNDPLEVYPIVIYTDSSFGYEGINKILNEKFKQQLENNYTKVIPHDVTLINLNFFEIQEDYLKQERINLFAMLNEYHTHVQGIEFTTTPFEVFSRFYMEANTNKDLGNPSFMLDVLKTIIPAQE